MYSPFSGFQAVFLWFLFRAPVCSTLTAPPLLLFSIGAYSCNFIGSLIVLFILYFSSTSPLALPFKGRSPLFSLFMFLLHTCNIPCRHSVSLAYLFYFITLMLYIFIFYFTANTHFILKMPIVSSSYLEGLSLFFPLKHLPT